MKKVNLLICTLLVLLFESAFISAQCGDSRSYVKSSSWAKGDYTHSSQSRSGAILSGEFYELNIIAQKGYDYRLAASPESKKGGSVAVELYEMIVESVDGEYKKIKNVIAVSMDSESKPIEFSSADKTRKLVAKVTLNGGNPKKPECVGILIEERKSTRLGF